MLSFNFGVSVVWDGFYLYVEGESFEPFIRKLGDLSDVLASPSQIRDPDAPAYFVYRGVHRNHDVKTFREKRIRHDITIIPPILNGNEPVKTYGHGHADDYPEIYQVIRGRGHFIFQRRTRDGYEVYLIEGEENSILPIPPAYEHITINPSNEVLILSNLISENCSSIYAHVREKRGACVYEVITNCGLKLVRNPNYEDCNVVIKRLRAPTISQSLYELFLYFPDSFDFLNDPTKFKEHVVSVEKFCVSAS